MDDTGTSGPTDRNALGTAMTVAGLAASVVTVIASGGLAILAGVVAVSCLAVSVAASLSLSETPFEEYCRECDQVAALREGQEVSNSETWQAEHSRAGLSHHWRQTVAAMDTAGRSR